MPNVGEEIVGAYLRYAKKCDFVTYNSLFPDEQGELDVLGIHLATNSVYICEVAVHVRGLNYVVAGRSATPEKIRDKFQRDSKYVKKIFPGRNYIYMLWSPVVSRGERLKSLEAELNLLQKKHGIAVELVFNEAFHLALEELREIAKETTYEFQESVMRLIQIQEVAHKRHLHKPKPKKCLTGSSS